MCILYVYLYKIIFLRSWVTAPDILVCSDLGPYVLLPVQPKILRVCIIGVSGHEGGDTLSKIR